MTGQPPLTSNCLKELLNGQRANQRKAAVQVNPLLLHKVIENSSRCNNSPSLSRKTKILVIPREGKLKTLPSWSHLVNCYYSENTSLSTLCVSRSECSMSSVTIANAFTKLRTKALCNNIPIWLIWTSVGLTTYTITVISTNFTIWLKIAHF